MSEATEAQAHAARAAIEERERAWSAELERCTCVRPHPDRVYLGWRACRVCGLLTGVRVVARKHP